MNKRKKYAENETIENLQGGKEYLEELAISERDFKEFSTLNCRTGSQGITKPQWRTTDGVKYPVTTYKLPQTQEASPNE